MSDPSPPIREIFGNAIAIRSADERAKYLYLACGGSAALRAEIDALIQAHLDAGTFFADSEGGGAEQTIAMGDTSIRTGAEVGPYKLLQQIGEGGMGSVWMAEQQKPVRRMVALKIIKAGMDSKEVIARFEAERQALAMMNHPNIAKVLDAGTTEAGRPFFVMELVKGVRITEFCDKNKYTTNQRLELFADVCRAVQHAHQKGIIHRDIKPSNVMVTLHDGVPVVKVIDFGLAKATSQRLTERTLFTAYGQMVGTPTYMSPEQAEMSGLDIDTRTDVYSLGVLLYELMTGTTPIDAKSLREAGFAEMQRIIQQEEAPPMSLRFSSLGGSTTVIADNRKSDPKRLSQLFRGDLDVIVHKALAKDRSRRYSTPNDFADDVNRFLSNVPIEARPASVAYRLHKLYQRNKLAVISTALVALSLLVATVVSTSQAIRATVAEGVAEDRLVEVQKAQVKTAAALEKESAALEKETLARQRANEALGEMKTVFGLAAANEGKIGEAMLRFADAALTVEKGSKHWVENKIRLRAWRRLMATPTHVLFRDGQMISSSLAFDSTGQLLASVSNDAILRVWRLDECAEELILESKDVSVAKWHPLRQELVVARSDGTIEFLSGITLQPRHSFKIGEPVSSLASSGDGRLWAVGGRSVRFFDDNGSSVPLSQIRHPDQIIFMEFRPDANAILTLCRDSLVRVYRLGEEAELVLPPLPHHHGYEVGPPKVLPAFILNGRGILTRPSNPLVAWTDIETGKLVRNIQASSISVSCIAASPDGSKFVVCRVTGEIELWNCKQNRRIPTSEQGRSVYSAAFTPDGLELLVATHGQGLARIDAINGIEVGERIPSISFWSHLAFGPDGTRIATGGPSHLIAVWDVRTAPPLVEASKATEIQHASDTTIRRVHLPGANPIVKLYGDRLICGGSDDVYGGTLQEARILDATNLNRLHKPFQTNALINDFCLSPNGTVLATASVRNEILFWNARLGTRLGRTVSLKSEPRAIEFSRDGSALFCLQIDGSISIFDSRSSEEIKTLQHGPFELPVYSKSGLWQGYYDGQQNLTHTLKGYLLGRPANNKLLVTGLMDESICLWDWTAGELACPAFELPKVPQACSISPDGKLMATALRDFFSVRDLENSLDLKFKIEEGGFVGGPIQFSKDSGRLALIVGAGHVSVWDIRHNPPSRISTMGPFQGYPAVAFADHLGRWLIIASGDGVQCWSVSSGRPVTPKTHDRLGLPQVTVAQDIRKAFVTASGSSAVTVVSLNDLDEVDGYSASDWKLFAEVLSKMELKGSKLAQINNLEWIEKFSQVREHSPHWFEKDLSVEDAVHRHRMRLHRALRAKDWYAAEWNVRWLEKRLGSRDREYLVENSTIKLLRATDQVREGKIDDALQLWMSVVNDLPHTESPELLDIAYRFSDALRNRKKYSAARRIGKQLIELNHDLLGVGNRQTIKVFSLLANCCWELEEIDAGNEWFGRLVAAYENLVATSAADVEAANQLALELVFCPIASLRDYDRAIELARKAVARYPTSIAYQRTLAIAQFRQGDMPSALKELNRLIALGGQDHHAEACYYLAMCHARLGEDAKSLEYFSQALQRDGQSLSTRERNATLRTETETVLRERGVIDGG